MSMDYSANHLSDFIRRANAFSAVTMQLESKRSREPLTKEGVVANIGDDTGGSGPSTRWSISRYHEIIAKRSAGVHVDDPGRRVIVEHSAFPSARCDTPGELLTRAELLAWLFVRPRRRGEVRGRPAGQASEGSFSAVSTPMFASE